MSVEKIHWVEQITDHQERNLKPVEGRWGTFFAGSDRKGYNCIVIPEVRASHQQEFGFFELSSEAQLYEGNCVKIEWDQENHEAAKIFLDDLLRTEKLIEDPVKIFRKKADVWKHIDQTALQKYINELTGLWGKWPLLKETLKWQNIGQDHQAQIAILVHLDLTLKSRPQEQKQDVKSIFQVQASSKVKKSNFMSSYLV
jgi:hypothetical protein